MQSKLFEVRDRATTMIVMATRFISTSPRERAMLRHAGYGSTQAAHATYLVLTPLDGGVERASSDCMQWGSRTLRAIHAYLQEHYNKHETGEVLDVEYLLGESSIAKLTDVSG